jgi:hypothetical protein
MPPRLSERQRAPHGSHNRTVAAHRRRGTSLAPGGRGNTRLAPGGAAEGGHSMGTRAMVSACTALLFLLLAPAPALAQKSLVSVKADQAPAIDGTMDGPWEKAPAYKFALDQTPYKPENYKGITKTNVTMRSMHDAEYVYFLVQWDDPTQSLERQPWVKQPDGKWKQLAGKDSTGHENLYYEDKLAMFWNVAAKGFDKKGCEAACHKARGGKIAGVADKSPGRKYTDTAGETIDMWHWKAVRTNPVGQVDDQYVDDTRDPAKNANWGRRTDAKTGGGYVDNVKKDKSGPVWMSKTPSGDKYWILDEQKTEFVDTFKAGDVVAGIVIAPFVGSRGDIAARAVWKNGAWTLEMKRKLVTGGDKAREQDVQFTDLKKAYYFGLSVFDNTAINHLYHDGVHRLTFK